MSRPFGRNPVSAAHLATLLLRRRRIVNFHGIGEPQRTLEPGESRFWLSTAQFHDLIDRIAERPERDGLAITFDDGNSSDHAIAAPYLASRGLTATFFPLVGRLGCPGSLGAHELHDLTAAGMTIGSHGIDHVDWSSLGLVALRSELRRSREVLEDLCGCSIRAASIPFGRYDAAVLDMIGACGYEVAYSSDAGTSDPSRFLQPRTSIRNDMPARLVDAMLEGRVSPIRRVRRLASMTLHQMF